MSARTFGGKLTGGTAAVAALVLACGASKPVAPPPPTTTVSSTCPDLARSDELGTFDFAKAYNLSREAADKLKAAALTAVEVTTLADKLDAELGIACAQIASGLGDRGDWRSGNDACAAAIKAVHDARAKLGPKATSQLLVRTPVCAADASLMTKCASICDSSVPAERVKAECEGKSGRCDGACDGTCETTGASKCEGVCTGLCEGAVKGSCGGRCKGTCDGRPVNGPCLGTCAGTCEKGPMTGECNGGCTGSCKLAKAGICEGVCAGTCSVDLAEAKCAGGFKTPDVSTDCRARCELAVMNQTECGTPHAGLVIAGAKDRETAEAMRGAVEKAFPGLLKLLFELGEEGPKRILNAQAVLDGTRTGFKEIASSGGKATAVAAEAQLAKCFEEPFKKAAAAAAAAKTGLDQAAGVRDELTK